MIDLLELEEQLVGMAVGSAAELSAVVREHDVDTPAGGLEGGQDVMIHQVHGSHRHLVRVPGASTAAAATPNRPNPTIRHSSPGSATACAPAPRADSTDVSPGGRHGRAHRLHCEDRHRCRRRRCGFQWRKFSDYSKLWTNRPKRGQAGPPMPGSVTEFPEEPLAGRAHFAPGIAGRRGARAVPHAGRKKTASFKSCRV